MSKRFESVNKDFFSYIEDNRSGLLYCTTNHNDMKDLANLLNKQAQRIAELEAQLKNAIVPKFKIGQEVFVIIQYVVRKTLINSFRVFESNELSYYCKYVDGERMYLELDENELFATKEEAESKLEELKGEQNVRI